MPSRLPTILLALALSALPTRAVLADAAGPCIDPGKVRAWTTLPERRVLIDAGREHFLVQLSARCPELADNPFLGYRSSHPAGRVCGRDGDSLVPHGSAAGHRARCPITALRTLDGDEYYRLLQASRHGVALDSEPHPVQP